MDESETAKFHRLVSLMQARVSKSTLHGDATCKVLFSSRHSRSLEKELGRISTVSLSTETANLNAAIRIYVAHRLKSSKTYHRLSQLDIGMDQMEEIEGDVVQKAAGMCSSCGQWMILSDLLLGKECSVTPGSSSTILPASYSRVVKS